MATEPELEMGMETEEAGAEEAPASAFDEYADDVFDDSLPIEDRRAALKAAVMACMDTDYSKKEPSKPKGDEGLALIFGGGKK